ncbi:MAG: YraN family protein [Prevotella sp.]|nr:YraN family protein [Bacteroides sp.]MCM1366267.1 YraN family protein [Prevotella sp.]MCM1436329.1 YraN family protein [Prevotella sp.]
MKNVVDTAKAKEFGHFAEQVASEYLLVNGYTVRERNWRPKMSHLEVDIIAQKGSTIVIVEVKARTSDFSDPADAVDDKKMRKLVRAASIYLSSCKENFDCRFDIITVRPRSSESEEVETYSSSFASKYAPKNMEPTLVTDTYILDHLPDAFLPPLMVSGRRQ